MTPLKIIVCALLIHNAFCAFLNLEKAFGKSLIASFEDIEDAARIAREADKEDANKPVEVTRNNDKEIQSSSTNEDSTTKSPAKRENAGGKTENGKEKGAEDSKVASEDVTTKVEFQNDTTINSESTEKVFGIVHVNVETRKQRRQDNSTVAALQGDNATHKLEQRARVAREGNFLEDYRRQVAERFRRSGKDIEKLDEAEQKSNTNADLESSENKEDEKLASELSELAATEKNLEKRNVETEEKSETLFESELTSQPSEVKRVRKDATEKSETDQSEEKSQLVGSEASQESITTGESRIKREPATTTRKDEVDEDDPYDDDQLVYERGEINRKRENRNKRLGRKWDSWGAWSPCSVSCGTGKITRWRHCIGPACSLGEKEAQIKTCSQPECPL